MADLHQLTTIEHRLVAKTFASLSNEARGVLRYKLAELFAYRSLSTLNSLNHIVGHEVVDVQLVEQSKKKKMSRLMLQLEDGTSRILEIRTPDDLSDEHTAPTRSLGVRPATQTDNQPPRASFFQGAVARARALLSRPR